MLAFDISNLSQIQLQPDAHFLVDEGRDDPNTTKSWLSSAHQQNTIYLVFRWGAVDGPLLNGRFVILQGIRTSIAMEPYSFWFSRGGRSSDACPP